MIARRKRWGVLVGALGLGLALVAACGVDAIGNALAPATPDAEAGLPPSLPEGSADGGADAPDPDAGETSVELGDHSVF